MNWYSFHLVVICQLSPALYFTLGSHCISFSKLRRWVYIVIIRSRCVCLLFFGPIFFIFDVNMIKPCREIELGTRRQDAERTIKEPDAWLAIAGRSACFCADEFSAFLWKKYDKGQWSGMYFDLARHLSPSCPFRPSLKERKESSSLSLKLEEGAKRRGCGHRLFTYLFIFSFAFPYLLRMPGRHATAHSHSRSCESTAWELVGVLPPKPLLAATEAKFPWS